MIKMDIMRIPEPFHFGSIICTCCGSQWKGTVKDSELDSAHCADCGKNAGVLQAHLSDANEINKIGIGLDEQHRLT